MKIRFIDLDEAAQKSGFYEKFPYFSTTVIPKSVYPNVDADTKTIGTGTLMIANKDMPDDIVYNILKGVYSTEGKTFLVSAAGKIVNQMTPKNAFRTITVPLHPGAVKFWKEQGKSIPAELM